LKYIALLLFILTAGCTVGPNYQRPAVATPEDFRSATVPPSDPSLAETKWFDLFEDQALTELVKTAIDRNHDLRIAADRVLEARAQLGLQRSQLYPTVNGTAAFQANKVSLEGPNRFIPPGVKLDTSYTQLGFNVNWDIDLFGRIRRLSEAARAQYLGAEDARRGVLTALIADVTTQYIELREFDLELDIAHKTAVNAQNGLRITTVRRNRGAATGLDVHQAETFLFTATSQIAQTEREITQAENALSVLIGGDPAPIARGKTLEELKSPPQVPAGLPSSLLERRPDIQQAEQNLIAANANIGAAKALLYPQISLTAFLGWQSRALGDLFLNSTRSWNSTPLTLTQPIFTAGAIRNGIRLTQAQQDEALENYTKTIQNAFREVSDALIGHRKTAEQRAQQDLLVKALRETDRLSTLRYQGGLDSYLQVLDAERNLFQGELLLAQLDREELLSVVQLYRALGGGWQ
jgi:NodT family efflux transporter outer membrane factor (OMF) lipoprotein